MKPKLNQIAIWGAGTDQSGRVSAIRRDGFYVRYRSIFPSTPGGHKAVFHSAFFAFADVVECPGFPPRGCVKLKAD